MGNKTVQWLMILLAFHSLGIRLMVLPLNRVIELRYCTAYYQEHDPSQIGQDGAVAEELCKIDDVQKNLAWAQGAIEFIEVGCGLLATIPYSAISEKGYRRLVLTSNVLGIAAMYLWLSVCGFFSSIPINAMFLGPFLVLIGGGPCTFQTIIATVIAESGTDPASRATYFAYTSSIHYVITLLSPALSALVMTLNLKLPFVIGETLLFICLFIVYQIGPQSRVTHREHDLSESSASLLNRRDSLETKIGQNRTLSEEISDTLGHIRRCFAEPKFRILLCIFFTTSFASANTPLLPQYISKRYGWTFAEAGVLLSAKASVNVLLLTVIVPWFIRWSLARPGANGEMVNIIGTRWSLAASVVGALAIAFSLRIWQLLASFLVYAIGSVITVFMMSLVHKSPDAALTDDNDDLPVVDDNRTDTQRYSVTMLVRIFGTLVGTPLMTAVWANGITFGGLALGSPFFLSAIAYALGYVLLRQYKAA